MWANKNKVDIKEGANNNWEVIVKRLDGSENPTAQEIKEMEIDNSFTNDDILPDEDILINSDWKWEDIFKFWKEFYYLIICAIIIILFMVFVIASWIKETSEEKQARIKEEISEVQQEYITIAEVNLVRLNSKKEIQAQLLSATNLDITIYEHCIMLNQTQELPVNCNSINLWLKQKLKWKVNSNWFSQEFKELNSLTPSERIEELLNMYTATVGTKDIFNKFDKQYWIKEWVAIAIAKADSSLGDEMKSTHNIGNVGNNDWWSVVHYKSKEAWIEAIYKALTNKYLGNIYNIGYLSQWGRITLGWVACKIKGEFCYATSEENWNINVINTLRLLYQDVTIDESFEFRT